MSEKVELFSGRNVRHGNSCPISPNKFLIPIGTFWGRFSKIAWQIKSARVGENYMI